MRGVGRLCDGWTLAFELGCFAFLAVGVAAKDGETGLLAVRAGERASGWLRRASCWLIA